MVDWLKPAMDHFRLHAKVERLGGEYDLNFRAADDDGPVILKVMRDGCDPALVEMQVSAIKHARLAGRDLPLPEVLGTPFSFRDDTGAARLAWAQRALPGRPFAEVAALSRFLLHDLGAMAGRLTRALQGFDHPLLERAQKWRLTEAGWIRDHLSVLTGARRALVEGILSAFDALRPTLDALPRQAVHNDLNDWNILIRQGIAAPSAVTGLIDFGDMTRAPVVTDLAILAAYAILDRDDPEAALAALVAGYHGACPVGEGELALIWPLIRMRLAVSVVNSTIEAAGRPDDPYVTISQAPAWRLLERDDLDPARILARLRLACGLPVVPEAHAILGWLDDMRGTFAPVVAHDITLFPVGDLSVGGSLCPENPFALSPGEAAQLGRTDTRWLGRYGEPRLIYTEPVFTGATKSSRRRTVHLGVDLFAPAGTALRAPLDGRVVRAGVEEGAQGYGGMVVLRHDTPAGSLYTLWGHLAAGCAHLKPGQRIAAGETFARVGDLPENGGWAPHLHLQLGFADDPDWD
ncbi:MAG: phosphotransferase, partial [Rhodobacteraceae bacterium]|nr:phosphotransferase [Paracoccaceae bacterium]